MKLSKALLEEKRVEVKKMLHYLHTSSKGSQEEIEYYTGMSYALEWVLGTNKNLYGCSGEIL